MQRTEYLYRLQRACARSLGASERLPALRARPESLLDVVRAVLEAVPGAAPDDVLAYVVPRAAAEPLARCGPVVGECRVECQACHCVPLQHVIFRACSHVFCAGCCLAGCRLRADGLACPACGLASDDLSWSAEVREQVAAARALRCPGCRARLADLDALRAHLAARPACAACGGPREYAARARRARRGGGRCLRLLGAVLASAAVASAAAALQAARARAIPLP